MALFIGILIILIVLFMVFAMALAEWADKDPGELIKGLVKKESPEEKFASVPAASVKEELKEPIITTVTKKAGTKKAVEKSTKKQTKTTKFKKRTVK